MRFGTMPCGDFLPWRKRREGKYDEEEGEDERAHLQKNGRSGHVSSRAAPFVTRSKSYSPSEESGLSRSYFLLSKLMCSEDLQIADQDCVSFVKGIIFKRDFESITKYLDGIPKEQIEEFEISGQKLLHILCFTRDVKTLQQLLSYYDVDPNPVNAEGVTPLHVAVSEGWTEGVKVMLLNGASANILPEARTVSSWPLQELPILTAARNGDLETSRLLLDQDPDLSLTDSEGNSALHLACSSHSVELIKRLLEDELVLSGISNGNNTGNSSLHSLMTANNLDDLESYEDEILECVQLLLSKRANINHVNVANEIPLYLAALANLPNIVKLLLDAGSDPFIESVDGKTVLHAACQSGSHESLSLLLERKYVSKLIVVEDDCGYAPFHIAVNSCSINCCEILLRNGDHLTALDSKNRSRCSLVIKNMPSALQLLNKVLDANIQISNEDSDDADFRVKLDFSVLLSESNEGIETSLVSEFDDEDFDSLLQHPLVEAFLHLNWRRIRWYFYFYIFLFFCFLIVHTFYIVKTYGMSTNWDNELQVLNMLRIAHIVIVIVLMTLGTLKYFANTIKFFKQWETYFNFVALSSAAFVVFIKGSSFQSDEIEKNIAAVSIFFTWVEFMMLLGRLPSVGIYILMFTTVAKSIVTFLFAFSPLLIAFTLSFGILLSKNEIFKTFPTAFVKTLMMMIGEIDYADIYKDIKSDHTVTMVVSQIFLVVFLFLIPILMANLLIGIAVNDLPDLQYHGKIRRLVKEASSIESYDRLLLILKKWTCVPISLINCLSGIADIEREITVYPNRINKYRNTIPPDAIKAAIACGTKQMSGKVKEDAETVIKKFYKEYCFNQERLEKVIQTLYNVVACREKNKGTDIPDCAFKCNKRKNSKRIY